jgi:hydrogenase-4 membrane subunit HyfE
MELPDSAYFYAVAGLSMAFVGFTSIVVVLHQTTGKSLTPFQVLITRLFAELGLMATGFALLAPTLAICGIGEELIWKISSVIMLAVLLPWLATYPIRRKTAAPHERFPIRGYIMNAIGTLAIVSLCVNVVGTPLRPGPAPLVFATVFVLAYASVSFFRTYASFLRE